MSKIRAAVVGYGNIGKYVVEALEAAADFEVAGIVRRAASVAAAGESKYPVVSSLTQLEGVDVASNLKWVMSSNSIAVMPRPTYETWFMEGTLIPNYHYIEIKPDYSDLLERIDYYNNHIDEAKEIIKHANEYARQFRNKKRENLISLMVLAKYFEKTGQNIN